MENCIITAINDILRQKQGLILIFVHICISREVEQLQPWREFIQFAREGDEVAKCSKMTVNAIKNMLPNFSSDHIKEHKYW